MDQLATESSNGLSMGIFRALSPHVVLRPIGIPDHEMYSRFAASLSLETRYRRFFSPRSVEPAEILALTHADGQSQVVVVAVATRHDRQEIIGEARYVPLPDGEHAEFALVVADQWQHCGLGTRLLRWLVAKASRSGLGVLVGSTLVENVPMRSMARRLGLRMRRNATDARVCELEIDLASIRDPGLGAAFSAP